MSKVIIITFYSNLKQMFYYFPSEVKLDRILDHGIDYFYLKPQLEYYLHLFLQL